MRMPAPSVPHRQLVTFRVGPSELGLDVAVAHEVLRVPPITPLPKAPPFIEGVIDLRGAWVPVVDLRRRLEVPDPVPGADARILVVELQGERLGLLVDRVTEVLPVPESALSAPSSYLEGRVADALQALVRLPGRLILVLDLDRVLTSDERLALGELESAIREALREADAMAKKGGSGEDGDP
jgi:purine-binding chemotaxis protein CheW